MPGAADIIGNGLAQLGETSGGTVMGPSFMEGVDSGLDDISGRIKVRLANFEVDDLFALLLQRAGAIQNFKGSFSTKPRHPAGETQFELSCCRHSGGWNYNALPRSAVKVR